VFHLHSFVKKIINIRKQKTQAIVVLSESGKLRNTHPNDKIGSDNRPEMFLSTAR
jgi:hypothetical protein